MVRSKKQLNIQWLSPTWNRVPGTAVLFDCSIADNIAYGTTTGQPCQKLWRAAKAANIHPFIETLPPRKWSWVTSCMWVESTADCVPPPAGPRVGFCTSTVTLDYTLKSMMQVSLLVNGNISCGVYLVPMSWENGWGQLLSHLKLFVVGCIRTIALFAFIPYGTSFL